LSELSRPEKVVYLIWCFVANVDNGGFSAFFYNNGGEHADETVLALRTVGYENIADLLLRVIALFPNSVVPADIEERNRAWNNLPEEKRSTVIQAADSTFFGIGSEALFRRTWEYWEREAGSPT
jgi:hypothetical protein